MLRCRFCALLLSVCLLFSLCACHQQETVLQDSSPITMYVGLGNNRAYYEALHRLILDELGIDVQFIYQFSLDSTNAMRLQMANQDLPADIVITASKTSDELLSGCCLDYLTCSHLTDFFSYSKIRECTAEDGGVYQLPFTSRLIGITYNKTLLEEMGWKVPETFADMVALKAACDEAGIRFAITDGVATGHGCNWLFHMMGAQWLSTLEGTEWFEGFLNGTVGIDAFAEQAIYFQQWKEAGLFGDVHNTDWNGATEFSQTRALFLYSIVNSVYSYDGPQYDKEGNILEGSQLHDEYASIPWISRDGSNNSYTMYDNMFLSLNAKLGADDQKNRLNQCLLILELMTTEKATFLYSDTYADGYVAVNSFQAPDNCMFTPYLESISAGYVQPWYYNELDANTINEVGGAVNRYIAGTDDTDMNDILEALDQGVALCLAQKASTTTTLAQVTETLDYPELAQLDAVCGAQSLQQALNQAGFSEEVQVSLMPYTAETGDLAPFISSLGVVSTRLYAGALDQGYLSTIIPAYARSPLAVRLSGARIKALVAAGLDKSGDLDYDSDIYTAYPIAMVTKGGLELADDQEYIVALNASCLTDAVYEQYLAEGRILTDAAGTPVTGNLTEGLKAYFSEHPIIDSQPIWE